MKLVKVQYVNGEARTEDNLKYSTTVLEAMIRREGKIEAGDFDFYWSQTVKVTYMETTESWQCFQPMNEEIITQTGPFQGHLSALLKYLYEDFQNFLRVFC